MAQRGLLGEPLSRFKRQQTDPSRTLRKVAIELSTQGRQVETLKPSPLNSAYGVTGKPRKSENFMLLGRKTTVVKPKP